MNETGVLVGQPGSLLHLVLTMAHRGSPHHWWGDTGTRQKDLGVPGVGKCTDRAQLAESKLSLDLRGEGEIRC